MPPTSRRSSTGAGLLPLPLLLDALAFPNDEGGSSNDCPLCCCRCCSISCRCFRCSVRQLASSRSRRFVAAGVGAAEAEWPDIMIR